MQDVEAELAALSAENERMMQDHIRLSTALGLDADAHIDMLADAAERLHADIERLKRKLDKKVLWGDGVRIILGEVSMQLHYKLAHTDKDGCVEWPCREVDYYLSRDEERCLKHRTDRAAAALEGEGE